MSDMNEQHKHPQTIMQLLQGAQVTAIVTAGIELGVFGAIAKGATTDGEVAKAIAAPASSTKTLLDALSVVGLLTKSGGRYANGPAAEAHLVPGKPMYMGDVTGIFSGATMWAGNARFAEAVKNGGTVLPEHAETPRHPFWESFARSSASIAGPAAQAIATELAPWLEARAKANAGGKVKALDVAAGSGLYGLTLAKTSPAIDVTLLDWPNVLVETKKWAERTGADASRVHYLEGNLFEVPFGGPYDLIVTSHVFHHFDDATCAKLTEKASAALLPGGRLVVHDFFYDETLANPMGALFRCTMLAWTKKGTTYTEADYRRWTGAAKLDVVSVKPSQGMPSTILVAEKK